MARPSPRIAVTPRAGWSMASSTSRPSRVRRRGLLLCLASFSIQRGCSTRTSVISANVARGSACSGSKVRTRGVVVVMSVVEALLLPRLVVGLAGLTDLLRLRLRRHRHVPPREAGDGGPRLDGNVDEAGAVLRAGLGQRAHQPLLAVRAEGDRAQAAG